MSNVCGCRYLCIFEILWTPPTILEGLANGHPKPDCYLFQKVSSFWSVSWCRLVASLWCWTWRWCTWRVLRWRCSGRTGTNVGRQSRDNKRYEVFRFAQKYSDLVWSTVVFERWPTRGKIRVLRRFFQVMELQACHRVFAPSRTDRDRERILVLPRLFALHRWPLPPLWGSWNSAEFPVHLSLKLCCSACALRLRSQPRILVPWEILKWAPALPWLQWKSY